MKIALFTPYDLARAGGVGSHVRAQARALRQLGHDVRIYGPASGPLPDGETAVGGSTAISFGGTESGLGLTPAALTRTRRVLGAEAFDVVHVHEPLTPLVGWSAVMCSRAPVVGTFHVYREAGHRLYPRARPLLERVIRRLDVRLAVSEAARRTVAAYFPGDYEIVPNGIELDRFAHREAFTVAPSRGMVLCVGRLEPRKGTAVLIEAMARVQRRLPSASLVLVGDGPDRAALEATAAACGARVDFVANVDDERLPECYAAADVVCAPALGGESFGIVILEALASRKPVVASRIDGYVATVGETAAVRFVPPGDADALGAQLIALLENAELRLALRKEALRVASRYDWTAIAKRLEDVYSRAVHRT